MAGETLSFQAEVSRLLEIVAHSLYSNKDVFLRELISNASDACDRLRYAALTDPALIAGDPELQVTILPDKAKRTITIADNGIGMNRQELIDNLGTIARSGTAAFVKELSGDAKKDVALIGQFGVGFYSAFMVAGEVEVLSRKAGETEAWRWVSNGKGEFSVEPAEKPGRGTVINLTLHDEDAEYADAERLKHIVRTYSDHVALPIVIEAQGKKETVNHAAALWMRPKREITDEQYREFYHHVGARLRRSVAHDPCQGGRDVRIHHSSLRARGEALRPVRSGAQEPRAELYVRRVFITDDCQELLPPYLRFLRGVVDSEDLPLNVSREMLQKNPMLAKMRGQIVAPRPRRARPQGQGRAGRIRDVLGQFRRRAERGALRRRRTPRRAVGARALPLHRCRWARRARRLCRAHEAGPGCDLHHHRRHRRRSPPGVRSSRGSARAASRCCS